MRTIINLSNKYLCQNIFFNCEFEIVIFLLLREKILVNFIRCQIVCRNRQVKSVNLLVAEFMVYKNLLLLGNSAFSLRIALITFN
jgi:hypothetical protein